MKRILYILLPALLAATSCKKSESSDADTPKYTSNNTTVLVSAFALKPNTKVLAHLDSVYFTIDTERMMIYNADSLPQGTDVSKLQVTMKFGSSVSSALFNVPGRVETIAYSSSMTDSIDFSKGSVILNVTSADGSNSVNYTINVNVHQSNPDAMTWVAGGIDNLGLEANSTVTSTRNDNGYYVIASDGSKMRLATTSSLFNAAWQVKDITLPTAAVRDLTAVGTTLYCLGLENDDSLTGKLLKSEDNGETWSDTGEQWRTIIGAYGDDLLGIARGAEMGSDYEAASFYHVDYPGYRSAPAKVAAGFPVEGMSAPIEMTSSWSIDPYIIIAGGKTTAGISTSNVWAYDGETWGLLSGKTGTLPALHGMCVVPYYTFTLNTDNYTAKRSDALYAFGGFYDDGAYNTRVFESTDKGLNWEPVDDDQQMPQAVYDKHFIGRAYVEATTISRDAAAMPWRRVAPTAPVTSWDCPHVFGIGKGTGGVPMTLDGLYTRLTYAPIY